MGEHESDVVLSSSARAPTPDGLFDGESGASFHDLNAHPVVESGLPVVMATVDEHERTRSDPYPPHLRTWREELPRWLATLDSARTRHEYEKAVRYFFEAPGVPEALDELTFDLLLAYRGSLALRAGGRHPSSTRPSTAATRARQILVGGSQERALPGEPAADGPAGPPPINAAEDSVDASATSQATTPLAPATVNVRLTALRQFLAHCSLWNLLPRLAPERIRAALRRLKIERRRPYQILAEPEWTAFLAAARAPQAALDAVLTASDATDESELAEHGTIPGAAAGVRAAAQEGPLEHDKTPHLTASADATHDRGPWGMPRARRARMQNEDARSVVAVNLDLPGDAGHPTPADAPHSGVVRSAPGPVRSRAGLTGVRTAQRDHALLALALATGLRAIELCGLDVGDLSREWHAGHEDWWLVLPDAKTKGQRGGRTLPLAPSLVETLLDYVRATDRRWEDAGDRATPLFLSRRRVSSNDAQETCMSSRLSPEQVRRIVDRVEAQWLASGAGVADGRAISPHALRHSTAVALLEGNDQRGRAPASVEHVRGWLGHFDIRTTQGYLAHLDARRHRRPFALQLGDDPQRPATGPSDLPQAPREGGNDKRLE